MNIITVNELKDLFGMTLKLIEKNNKIKYEFNFDSYWTISNKDWKSFDQVPEPGVGSLNDDIFYLKEDIARKDKFSFIDVDRIGTILKAISDTEAPT